MLVSRRSQIWPVVLPDGRVLAAGGFDDNGNGTSDAQVFTPPSWTNPFGY